MSYNCITEMASSQSLMARIVAAAAQEGQQGPLAWAQEHTWQLASSPGWDEAWQYAMDTANYNVNPDMGKRTDVITDGMILSAVQALRTAQAG